MKHWLTLLLSGVGGINASKIWRNWVMAGSLIQYSSVRARNEAADLYLRFSELIFQHLKTSAVNDQHVNTGLLIAKVNLPEISS